MARYCFYCGRELKAGERCTCRGSQVRQAGSSAGEGSTAYQGASSYNSSQPYEGKATYSSTGYTGTDGQSTSGSQEPDTKRHWRDRLNQRKADRAYRKAQSDQFRQDRQGRVKQERAARQRQPRTGNWQQSVFAFGRNILRAITRPTAFIQDASKPTRATAMITQVVEAFLIAFTVVRILLSSNLGNLVIFGSGQLQTRLGFSDQLLLFLPAFGVCLLFFVLRTFINNGILRFVLRYPQKPMESAFLLTPGSIYYCLFLIAGLLLSAGSGMQSLVLIVAGYGVRVLIDHIAIRMETALTEDQMIRFSLLTFLITALVIGSLIGMVTPNLSGFQGNIPGGFA